ncbi:MAG: glycerophosphodiester phosphodiesterase family protein [Sphaerochaetaceae bacterium]
MQYSYFPNIERPLIFGHRGFSSEAPENSMPAFDLCVERNIGGVELDVHLCKSGELVVIHDHNLKRLAGIDRRVEELTLGQLKELDIGSHKGQTFRGEKIPTLEELFKRHGKALYYDIEIKEESAKQTPIGGILKALIEQYTLGNQCIVSSFNPFALRYFRKISGNTIPTATIFAESGEVPRFLWHGWGRHISRSPLLKPDRQQVNEQFIKKFRLHKRYPIISWTVNSKEEGLRLLQMGVEGLISDNPDLFTP